MQIDMVFKNLESSDRVKEFITEKTGKLKKFFHAQIHARWNLEYAKNSNTVHLHVNGNNIDYFAEVVDENLFTAVEEAVDKLERQLKRKKEQVKDHHK